MRTTAAAACHATAAHYISLEEAGARLSIHPRTLRRAIAAGELPGYKFGLNALRVCVADLDKWIAAKAIPNARSTRRPA